MNYGLIHSVWTVMMFALFIGIIVWAWSTKRKKQFDEAARLPLEDDDNHSLPPSPRGRGQEQRVPLDPTPSPSRGEGALTPTPLPQAGEGSSVRPEPSALPAASYARGEKNHG